jgi:hypothetical protein
MEATVWPYSTWEAQIRARAVRFSKSPCEKCFASRIARMRAPMGIAD